MITITPLSALKDNYIWVIHNQTHALVIDPGEYQPVAQFLTQNHLSLAMTLLTHHHLDHTGGALQLQQDFGGLIGASSNQAINFANQRYGDGQKFFIDDLGLEVEVFELPGHTLDHLGFLFSDHKHQPHFFCGDTLFSAGCGRLFEGTPSQIWNSLCKISRLSDETLLYPAHEYTLSNIEFARQVEPESPDLIAYQQHAMQKRAQQQPSLPTRLVLEKQINPFLRAKFPAVIAAAENFSRKKLSDPVEVFASIRQWKDRS